MGKIVSTVTDAVGLTDTKGQEKAAKGAAAAQANSLAMTKEQLAFMKEQYADWKAVYGDVQTNLGTYYKNLTPEKITALGLENQQREFQIASAEVDKMFAQKGIAPTSGMAVHTKATATFQNAEARAKIRSSAEQDVADEKLKFLGVGLGQGAQMLGTISNAYNTGITTQANVGNNSLNNSTSLSQSNSNTMGDIFGFLSGG